MRWCRVGLRPGCRLESSQSPATSAESEPSQTETAGSRLHLQASDIRGPHTQTLRLGSFTQAESDNEAETDSERFRNYNLFPHIHSGKFLEVKH